MAVEGQQIGGYMEKLKIPENYEPLMDIRETEEAIKLVKDFFERELAKNLNLTRVSAPLFVIPQSGLMII